MALECSEMKELGSELDYFLGKMFWLNIFASGASRTQISPLKVDTFSKSSVDIPMVQGPYLNI